MDSIKNQTYDQERALYGLRNTIVQDCVIDGPADGESAFKEAADIQILNTRFNLRYPLWHCRHFRLSDISMSENTRAALWYDNDGTISNSKLHGIKALRECTDLHISNCDIISDECGWKSSGFDISDSSIASAYFYLDSRDGRFSNLKFMGKYSFQYTENITISDSTLDTKDAFWHGKNITVRNSTIKGEYLAWFSENLTLENCTVIGTQPFCYCKGLKLINCRLIDCDLAFEYSDVEADIIGKVDSIKNPKSGTITCDDVGEIIMTSDAVMECNGKIIKRNA